jgi:Bacterial cellulose synthase subunit
MIGLFIAAAVTAAPAPLPGPPPASAGREDVAPAARAEGADEVAPRFEVVPVRLDEVGRLPELRVPFRARGDRALVRARLVLTVDPTAGQAFPGLDVLVNDRAVGAVPATAAGTQAFEIAGDALGDRNTLTLRLAGSHDACAPPAPGAWRALRASSLELMTVPLALPADLGLLPLPFVDPEVDRAADVAVVLPGLSPQAIRAAAIVAGWLGTLGGVPLRFRTLDGELPPGDAIVLVDGAASARRLGLAPPSRAAVRVAPSPRAAGARLLVVEADGAAALVAAAERLAEAGRSLAGPSASLAGVAPPKAARPYEAPRWLPSGRPVRFADVPGRGALAHAGLADGTIEVRFRIPPDLWTWPDDSVLLDLGYAQRLPRGVPAPKLDVDLNGEYLATLPALSAAAAGRDEAVGRASLAVPAERLRGFDVLALHVRYPLAPACASPDDEPTVRVAPDSALHIERYGHYASLPDLSRVLYDGYPFTRVPDLGETLAVLPEPPRPGAVSALLSLAAHFATITGRAGTRLAVATASSLHDAPSDRDLLVLGVPPTDPILLAMRDELPLWVDRGAAEVRMPPAASAALDLLAGAPGRLESARARAVVTTLGAFAALQQVPSPYSRGRSAVLLLARDGDDLPAVPELLGHADSRTPAGDLLVVSGERRWMFRIGPSFGVGELDPLSRLRWFLHEHWLALVPALLGGAALVAMPVRGALAARARERLEPRDEG